MKKMVGNMSDSCSKKEQQTMAVWQVDDVGNFLTTLNYITNYVDEN
jgi:hypothetical protein